MYGSDISTSPVEVMITWFPDAVAGKSDDNDDRKFIVCEPSETVIYIKDTISVQLLR